MPQSRVVTVKTPSLVNFDLTASKSKSLPDIHVRGVVSPSPPIFLLQRHRQDGSTENTTWTADTGAETSAESPPSPGRWDFNNSATSRRQTRRSRRHGDRLHGRGQAHGQASSREAGHSSRGMTVSAWVSCPERTRSRSTSHQRLHSASSAPSEAPSSQEAVSYKPAPSAGEPSQPPA